MAAVKTTKTVRKTRKPKKTRQGKSKNTKYSISPKRHAKKMYRGQGK